METAIGISSEQETLAAARDGDRDALASLYREHSEMVYGAALGLLKNPVDAEDVLQDVFVGLPEALDTFEGRGSFEGWLKRIAVRTALMKLRRRSGREETSLEDAPPVRSAEASPEATLSRIDLRRALEHLSEALHKVFVLHEVLGYTHDECAEMLGISTSASQVRLHRARKQLRTILETE